MYRIFLLLLALSTMAIEDSEEAKYIDLLPEEEKQEFLNRIARRILQEIQSKDSPEQSQVEVTDDQLHAHDAYVQDIVKEESENHRMERTYSQKKKREQGNNNEESKSDPSLKDKVFAENDMSEDSENRHDIDLTLQNERETDNTKRNFQVEDQKPNENVDTNKTLSYVIPVKVTYDADNNNAMSIINTSTISTREDNTSSTDFKKMESTEEFENANKQNNSQSNEVISKIKDFNESRTDYLLNEGPEGKAMSEKTYDELHETTTFPTIESSDSNVFKNLENTYDSEDKLKVPEEQLSNSSMNHDELSNNTTKKSEKKDGSESFINATLFTNSIKLNTKFNNSSENIESSTNLIISSERNLGNVEPTFKETDVKVDNYTALMRAKNHGTVSPMIPNLTTYASGSISINSSYEKDKFRTIKISNNTEKIAKEMKTEINISVGITDRKKYLRKRLDILSKEYSLETVESYNNKNYLKDQGLHENKDHDREYEAPGKPAFPDMVGSKKYGEPYYVPIHNFAPNNAYYNAHNLFGPNDDDDVKEIKRSSIDNDEDNKDLYVRNDFKIELYPKNHQHIIDRNDQYRYSTEKYINSPRAPINIAKPKNPDFKYTPSFDMDYYLDTLRRNDDDEDYENEIKRNVKKISQPNTFDMDYFSIDHSVDGDLRRKSRKAKRNGRQELYKKLKNGNDIMLPNSSEEDHPYYSIFKGNIKNHVRAVRKLLFQQKKFGFMSPTPHEVKAEPRHKRMFGGGTNLTTVDNDLIERRINNNGLFNGLNQNGIYGIELDYYWGRLLNFSKISADDVDDNFADFNNNTTKLKEIENNEMIRKLKNLNSILHPYSQITDIKSVKNFADGLDYSLDALINVLRDMIQRDNSYLSSYDWLLSTVDIEGALKKLRALTESVENGYKIHPLDAKLLHYVIYLYNISKDMAKKNISPTKNGRNSKSRYNNLQDSNNSRHGIANFLSRIRTLPKGNRRKPGEKIKNPIRLWRMLYDYYSRILSKEYDIHADLLRRFKILLRDLEDYLYELHNAIRHIAIITTYKTQNWYEDIKNIYLKSATKRQLLKVLLHLGTSKLISSIEESVKKGAEYSVLYIKNNREVIRNVQEDFVFVLAVMDGIKKLN